jgi:hypothetical protein
LSSILLNSIPLFIYNISFVLIHLSIGALFDSIFLPLWIVLQDVWECKCHWYTSSLLFW